MVQAATSAAQPGGWPDAPFAIANANVSLKYTPFTSAELFIDKKPAQSGTQTQTAFVLYSSQQGHPFPVAAVVEQLDETWTQTTGAASVPSGPSDEGEVSGELQASGSSTVRTCTSTMLTFIMYSTSLLCSTVLSLLRRTPHA